MEFFKLVSVLLAITELSSALLYFLIYFIEYHVCENETNFKHLEEVLLALCINIFVASLSSFIYALSLLVISLRSAGHYLAFANKSPDPYRRAFVCYRFLCIIFSFSYAVLGIIVGIMFLAVYACQVRDFYWDALCAIDPHLVFGVFGYYMTMSLLILNLFCVPSLISRLVPN